MLCYSYLINQLTLLDDEQKFLPLTAATNKAQIYLLQYFISDIFTILNLNMCYIFVTFDSSAAEK